jgi:hypothetical protein
MNCFSLGPGYLFGDSLSNFNWITWIKPDSKLLVLITGGINGLGLNPLPTLDWNRLEGDVLPSFYVSLILAPRHTIFHVGEFLYGNGNSWVLFLFASVPSQRLVYGVLAVQYESSI